MDIKPNIVIVLYLTGKSQPVIVRELRHLHVNKMLVHRTIKRYNLALLNGIEAVIRK